MRAFKLIIQLLKPAGSYHVDRPINSCFFSYYFVGVGLTEILCAAKLKVCSIVYVYRYAEVHAVRGIKQWYSVPPGVREDILGGT